MFDITEERRDQSAHDIQTLAHNTSRYTLAYIRTLQMSTVAPGERTTECWFTW